MFAKPEGIPRSSGVYLFRNAQETVIYVGKAKVLAQRLSNYFQRPGALDVKTQNLMAEATAVEWIVTPSELDALVLENELIKANQPRYNLRLKDDKTFPYVAIDVRGPDPIPFITRGRHHKGVLYFGPFVDVKSLRTSFDELLQVYPLRTCSNHKFNYQQRIGRPCLLFDIGRCPGPCVRSDLQEHNARAVASWTSFYEGNIRPLRDVLTGQMDEASKRRHFEAAAKFRDALESLDRASSSQVVVLDDHTNLDAIAVTVNGGRAAVIRFKVRHGRITGRTLHFVDRSLDEDSSEILLACLPDIYRSADDIPPQVILAEGSLNSELLGQFLDSRRGRAVAVTSPERGRKRRIIELAVADAESVISRDTLRRTHDHNLRSQALNEIATALGLPSAPFRMECFDMSHLQGTNYVGSMVVFVDGMPQVSDYRHFNVKEVLGNDDAGAMREVLLRRLRHWRDDQMSTKFRRADLIVIDGGLPQLHAAESAARELGIENEVQFCSLAKREELIYRPGSSTPIALPRGSEGLYLMQRIRDEAHRFAITFHRSKRGRAMVRTVLDGIEGLGPARQEKLLAQFGSLDVLRSASLEELTALSWLPDEVAERLYDHLRGSKPRQLYKEGDSDD
jgi:excinuclease ABC subunit C